MTIDRETLIAYADGELNDLERARVEKAIAADPDLARAVERHRKLRQRVSGHYEPFCGQPVPERLTALLGSAGNVASLDEKRRVRSARWSTPQWVAIAATLVLGLMIGGTIDLGRSPVASRGGALVAAGPLESALDTQLASAQPADAPVRIGLTFRDESGAFCRSFDQPALAGIACRDGGEWQLRRTIAGERQETQYRQASSPAIAAAAQAMMAGAPLDAAAERAARDADWE